MRAVAHETCDTVMDNQADAVAEFDSLAGIERYLDMTVADQVERQARGCPFHARHADGAAKVRIDTRSENHS